MRYIADIHLHSRFARATSKALNPLTLHRWGLIKGLSVVGTGDYTHPVWFEELQAHLEPAEEGLFQLREVFRKEAEADLPAACQGIMRFVLSVEISVIYKKNDKTRKVHHVVMMPDFDAVARLNAKLGAIGNLKSDGRPILGLDSRDLVEVCLEACEDVLFIPAHIWTPHFAVLGASSGFDTLEECFEDMLPHIFAVETGLSSDPPMNWRLSMLDRYAIVSNSDAHSPQKLAREATCFDTDLSYWGMFSALKDQTSGGFTGTLEFYPEEGKYHFDGHRKCDVCWKPPQTIAAEGKCPVCGRKLTVGVLHRAEKLADRSEGFRPDHARPFESLIPLPEIIGSVMQVGPNSKRVQNQYEQMLQTLGSELRILRELPIDEIAEVDALVAEGVRRMRAGEVHIDPGYDGVYGKIQVFSEEDRAVLTGQAALFQMPGRKESRKSQNEGRRPEKPVEKSVNEEEDGARDSGDGLDEAQRKAVEVAKGPVVVIAGPGTGKTRVLTHRVAHLIRSEHVLPGKIMAVTFTNRAAVEMRERIAGLLADVPPEALTVGTFHRIALDLIGQYTPDRLRDVVDARDARDVLREVLQDVGGERSVGETASAISLLKADGKGPDEAEDDELRAVFKEYEARLYAYGVMDFDDILLICLDMLNADAGILCAVHKRFAHVLVDEFQDVNAVQYRLVKKLVGRADGLFVIGDPDQAIYGFRGASPVYFRKLFEDYPQVERIELTKTYRSTRTIVSAASGVLSGTGQDRVFESVRENGPKIRVLSTPGETGEGIAIVEEISQMVGGADMLEANEEGHRSFDDFAVLFRTGRQADALEACFAEAGIPYRVVGQTSYLDAPNVQRGLAFFTYVQRGDNRSLVRALPGTVDAKDRALIRRWLADNGDLSDLPDGLRAQIQALSEDADRYRGLTGEITVDELLNRWGEAGGVAEDEDFLRLMGVAKAARSLGELLDTLTLGMGADHRREGRITQPESVTLMTLHASKGLEFPVIFICGVEEGLIPYRERDADLEEERRLFFVGLTRGQDEVVLTHTRRRVRFGERIEPQVSPFVGDISGDLLERVALRADGPDRSAEQLSLF